MLEWSCGFLNKQKRETRSILLFQESLHLNIAPLSFNFTCLEIDSIVQLCRVVYR